jgi:predicted dehydrogenase
MGKTDISRRIFIGGVAATAAAGYALARTPSLKRLGFKSPNEKLNIAAIGCGGKGASDIAGCRGENIVALCDADWVTAKKTFDQHPNAKKYKDFREMLAKERSIDAVIVSTPDHFHAVAAMAAMKMGKHVYVQKPMTHTIFEARALTEAARKYGVMTQMGNQGHCSEGIRLCCEMIWADTIGPVKEVHAWTNRPIWPQGVKERLPEEKIPETFAWDIWLGPAPYRPYNKGYAPFNWRGWWDFGCGALGDMACHILDAPNWALLLEAPTSVECISQEGGSKEGPPTKAIIKFEFPARKGMPPVTLFWYDGGNLPKYPQGLDPSVRLGDLRGPQNGSLFVGEKGFITTGTYANDTRLVPEEKMKDFKPPMQVIPRSAQAGGFTSQREWVYACKTGMPASSNFDVSGPFTEWVLLGNVALRVPGKLLWNSARMEFTNNKEANQYIKTKYRKGWSL